MQTIGLILIELRLCAASLTRNLHRLKAKKQDGYISYTQDWAEGPICDAERILVRNSLIRGMGKSLQALNCLTRSTLSFHDAWILPNFTPGLVG